MKCAFLFILFYKKIRNLILKFLTFSFVILKIKIICRKEGIRTLDTVTRIPPFQGGLFNHSSTFLLILQMYKIFFNYKTSPLSNFYKTAGKNFLYI